MSPLELTELWQQLISLLDSSFIQPSKAPIDVLVLLQREQYQALNKVTVKNKYPVSFIQDLFGHLSKATYFS